MNKVTVKDLYKNSPHLLDYWNHGDSGSYEHFRYITDSEVRKTAHKVISASQLDKQVQSILNNENSFVQNRAICLDMSKKLNEIGQSRIAEKLKDDYAVGSYYVYEKGTKFFASFSSGERKLSPFAARYDQKKKLEKLLFGIRSINEQNNNSVRWYLLTPTSKNFKLGDLEKGYKVMWESWNKFRRSVSMKNCIAASVKVEVTYNLVSESWNLHLHCLIAVSGNFNYGDIRDTWGDRVKSLGWVGSNIQIDKVENSNIVGAVKEISKYITKFKVSESDSYAVSKGIKGVGILDMPTQAFSEWFHCFRGKRTYRTYGDLYSIDYVEPLESDLGDLLAIFGVNASKKYQIDVVLIQRHKSTDALEKTLIRELEKLGTGHRMPKMTKNKYIH